MNLGEGSSKGLEYHLFHQPVIEQGSALPCPILCAPMAYLGIYHASLCFYIYLCLHSVNSLMAGTGFYLAGDTVCWPELYISTVCT